MSDGRARWWILAAMAAGLAARLAFGFGYWTHKPLTHDEREYLALARNVAAGRGFTYQPGRETGTAQQFGRAPGYPLFLAGVGVPGHEVESTPARVKIAQALAGALVVGLIGLVALRAAGTRAAIAASSIAAVYPPLVWMCAYVLSETLFSLLAIATALVLDRAMDRARTHRAGGAGAIGAGLLAGAATLVRPVMLFFLPLALLWLLRRRRPALAIAFLVAALAVVLPWTARNYRVHGRFVLVASEGGVTFWTGNHPLARGDGDLAANPELKRAELAFRAAHPGLSAEELEPLYYRDALLRIAEAPGRWLTLVARKAFYTAVPIGPSYTLHSWRYVAASVASYVLLLPFALAGLRRLWRSAARPTSLLLLASAVIVAGLVFFPQERFRIPVLDPAMIVCAAALAARAERS
jgi:4-amino-4-deoxy-L-arabinose transferase-like glycosyltransferase